jgi:hypothetical protein
MKLFWCLPLRDALFYCVNAMGFISNLYDDLQSVAVWGAQQAIPVQLRGCLVRFVFIENLMPCRRGEPCFPIAPPANSAVNRCISRLQVID